MKTITFITASLERVIRALSEYGQHQRNLAAETANEGMSKGYANESKACYTLANYLRDANPDPEQDYIYEAVVYDGAMKYWRILNLNSLTVYGTHYDTREEADAAIKDGEERAGKIVKKVWLQRPVAEFRNTTVV